MKRYKVVFTPYAERQLDALYAYIAARGGMKRADLSLATFPEHGTKRDDIRPNLRTKGYARRATIAFAVDTTQQTVVIHGVFYGGQDFESLMRTDGDA